jgi:hypothetical protein
MEPLAVNPRDAAELLGGVGRKKVYALIAAGQLESYLDGCARKITTASIRAYVDRKVAEERERVEAREARRRNATKRITELRGRHGPEGGGDGDRGLPGRQGRHPLAPLGDS